MIIGSVAIKFHFPSLNREPKDYDIIALDQYNKLDLERIHRGDLDKRLEILINPVLFNYYKGSVPNMCGTNELYTLKASHSFWDLSNNSWQKHIYDCVFLKEQGCELIFPLFYDLYDYWVKLHGGNKRSNLNMTANDFFDNAIKCPIPHDDLHELLLQHEYFKNQTKPTYTNILKDGAEVEVEEEKFNKLSEEEKYKLVVEEVMVMAFERWSEKTNFRLAFELMMKKFLIGHAPMWEAIWMINNYKKLLRCPFNYQTFLKNKTNEYN